MRIWHPKKLPPCHDNGHLQSASDAHAYRSRFRRNPWAKMGSILMPTVLRFGAAAGRRRCCCEEVNACGGIGTLPDEFVLDIPSNPLYSYGSWNGLIYCCSFLSDTQVVLQRVSGCCYAYMYPFGNCYPLRWTLIVTGTTGVLILHGYSNLCGVPSPYHRAAWGYTTSAYNFCDEVEYTYVDRNLPVTDARPVVLTGEC